MGWMSWRQNLGAGAGSTPSSKQESHVEYGWGKQHKATKLMGVPQQLGIRQFQVTRVVAKMSASIRHKILHLQAVIDWKSLHWKDRHPTTIADL